jgi:hypothetical protein
MLWQRKQHATKKMKTINLICAAAVVALLGSMTDAPGAYSVCAPADNIHRQHVVCGATACPSGELSVFSTAASHPMCGGSSSAADAPAPPTPAAQVRAPQASRSCGRHWSEWEARNRSVGNPCPSGCKRESKVRDETRGSGRRAEHRELWLCTGTPR